MALISKSDCVEILENKFGHSKFQLEDFCLNYFEELLGFNSNHASLNIQTILDGEVLEFNFFLKTSTGNYEVNKHFWKVLGQANKEHIFLTQLAKPLQGFVSKKITADCYLSRLDKFTVLEDLCKLDFETSKLPDLDLLHIDKALEAFANLHAASLLYEEETGISISEKYKDIMYESLLVEVENRSEFLLYSLDVGVRTMGEKYYSHLGTDKELQKVFDQVRKRVVETQTHSKKFRKVLCQGDAWGNNVLYKYNNEGKPIDAILVDFGCIRYAPPAMELMQFLYIGISADLGMKYKSHIIDSYYKHLGTILSNNGLDVADILPKAEFMESCDVYEEFGVCCRVYYNYATQLPHASLTKAASTVENYLDLMIRGVTDIPIEGYENDGAYRQKLTEGIEGAFRFYK